MKSAFPITAGQRRGAVIPLFALLLPVLIVLASIAINVSYMQLTRTELKVATDAAARAGGRAWSEHQTIAMAKQFAKNAAKKNKVAGGKLKLRGANNKNEIEFGMSVRGDNGYGRYAFTKKQTSDVAAGTEQATSIRITGKRDTGSLGGAVSMLFGGVGNMTIFEPTVQSVCTQVDRDIALILDRSGSMAFHEEYIGDASGGSWNDLEGWVDDQLSDLADAGSHREYYYDRYGRRRSRRVWDDMGIRDQYNAMLDYKNGLADYRNNGGDTPSPSRWDALVESVNAFLNVLEITDQEEQVALGSFNSSGRLDLNQQTTYDAIRNFVDNTRPSGGTAIHNGMESAFGALFGNPFPDGSPNPDGSANARSFAAKTVVVLTDGRNSSNASAIVPAAQNIVSRFNVTIHTVTFSPGADQAAMRAVADTGGGKHYHSNDRTGLIQIFEDIANNLPTIITQ